MKIGYFNGQRLHIKDYNDAAHADKVYCADGHLLIPKRGEVRQHHFSHRAGEGNNECSKFKGDWHVWWQSRLLPSAIESRFIKPVKVKPNDPVEQVMKIADSINIIGENKDVLSIVEFQHSVMSTEEIAFREAFYTRTDLLSHCGLPYCKAELTWIFDLTSSDIEIDFVFGDIVCFRHLKGTKYFFDSKCRSFWDFGKRDLILFIDSYKTKTQEPRIIGRLVPLKSVDDFLFKGALTEPLSFEQQRLNCLPLADYKSLPFSIDKTQMIVIIELVKQCYFLNYKKSKAKLLQKQIEDLITRLQ